MKLGLYFPFQLPRPWTKGAEQRLFFEALDQVELADKLGFDYAWVPEQHFLEEYSHSSAPEVFLAAASQRTNRIRMGHGIVLMPPAFNSPTRVAERAAALDLVSGGRVEFGVGDSKSRMELEGFGIDPGHRREMTHDALVEVVRMWTQSPYPGADGQYVNTATRNVVPKPAQTPHPPLWMACSDDDAVRRAARLGLGVLTHSFYDVAEAEQLVTLYHQTFDAECEPLTATVNPQIAMLNPFYCHQDEAIALGRGRDAAGFMTFAVRHYYAFGHHRPGISDLWDKYSQVRERYGAELPLRGTHAIGTPEQIRQHLQQFADVGIDQTILVHQAGDLTHSEIVASMGLFAESVMPHMMGLRRSARIRRAALAGAISSAIARHCLPDMGSLDPDEGVEAYGRSRPPVDPAGLTPAAKEQIDDLRRMAEIAQTLE